MQHTNQMLYLLHSQIITSLDPLLVFCVFRPPYHRELPDTLLSSSLIVRPRMSSWTRVLESRASLRRGSSMLRLLCSSYRSGKNLSLVVLSEAVYAHRGWIFGQFPRQRFLVVDIPMCYKVRRRSATPASSDSPPVAGSS